MTTTDTAATTLAVLPIDAITVREGWNPRSADDAIEKAMSSTEVKLRARKSIQPTVSSIGKVKDGMPKNQSW